MQHTLLRVLAIAAVLTAAVNVRGPIASAQQSATVPTQPPAPTPAPSSTPLPYPAYGAAVPGVGSGVVNPNVPQTITLQQAIAIGYASSPLLAQARAQLAIATAPVGAAQSALLPSISASGSTTRSFQQAGSRTTTVGSGGSSTTTSALQYTSNGLDATLKQLIFDGGKIFDQLRAAKDTEKSSAATYQRELQTVAYNVATAYYNLLAARRATQVAVETVNVDVVNEQLVSAQIKAGSEAAADLSTAQLQTAQGRLAVVKDQGAELSAQAAFANAMGLDANTYVLAKDDSPPPGSPIQLAVQIPSYDKAMVRALALRPDVFSAHYATESQRASLKAAKLGLFPTIDGNASYGTNSTDVTGGTYRNSGSVGIAISIPIYDQGLTRAQVAQAQGNVDLAVANENATIQGVQLNVKQSLVNLVSAREGLTQANAELVKAQEVLKSTQAQYKAGVTTLPLLLNAQVGYTQALTDQATAVYTLQQAQQAFLYAEGSNTGG